MTNSIEGMKQGRWIGSFHHRRSSSSSAAADASDDEGGGGGGSMLVGLCVQEYKVRVSVKSSRQFLFDLQVNLHSMGRPTTMPWSLTPSLSSTRRNLPPLSSRSCGFPSFIARRVTLHCALTGIHKRISNVVMLLNEIARNKITQRSHGLSIIVRKCILFLSPTVCAEFHPTGAMTKCTMLAFPIIALKTISSPA